MTKLADTETCVSENGVEFFACVSAACQRKSPIYYSKDYDFNRDESMASPNVNVFDEISKNPMTALGARYSKQDVLNVWGRLAERIRELLKEEKGIVVKGLGTFSLSNWTLETGNNGRIVEMRKPIFVISRSLAEEYDLHQRKEYVNDAVPLAPVSYKWLSENCNLSKENVLGCIEETVQCFRRIVSEGRDVEFPLSPLGNLVVAKTNVSFVFYDLCKRKIQERSKPCAKFAAAKVNYTKKLKVPCSAHLGQFA